MKNALIIKNVTKNFYKKMEGKNEHDSKSLNILRKLFRKKEVETLRVINNISISISRGEIYGILGENGSGKSTLIRMISTLLTPDEGNISIFGHDVIDKPQIVQKMMNRVSVEASFFKKLSPVENLSYTARLYGMNVKDAEERIMKILDSLNFDLERMNDSMEDFSRGMQQKIAISRALLTTPVLLLLDEPTTGLDPKSKLDVKDFILRTRKEHDTTMLLTTHDMTEAEELCDRIAILRKGDIIAEGTTEELKAKYTESGDGSLEEVFLTLTGDTYGKEDDTG